MEPQQTAIGSNIGPASPSTEEQGDETTSAEDVESDDTNPLDEAIINEVNVALSASGITGPGF